MKLCDTCIYGDKYEYDKPCVIYSDHCEMYKKKVVAAEDIWVSLRAVVDVLTKNRVHFCDMIRITSELKELPPVNPQEPRAGHWIGHREHCENLGVMPSGLGAYEWCSNCDCGIDVKEWHRNNYNYCPNCGAKMVELQERSDKE